MTFYSSSFRKATVSTEYARRLALDAHPKSGWVFQDPNFTDHAPGRPPERLDHIAVQVVDEVGQRALDHWLREAAQTDGEDRDAALEMAREIAAMIDVPWDEVMSGLAA